MSNETIFRMERVRGASIGATIVGGFGAAWLALGMTGVGIPLFAGASIVFPVFALIAFLGAVVRRRLPKFPETPEKKAMMRAFAVVNVVQWVAIFGTANLLHNLHLDGWIASTIVLIVGAHFIPIARIFHTPQHLKTGIAMMLLAALAAVLPAAARDVVVCMVAGVILWVNAAGALYAAFHMAPPSKLLSQAGL